MRVDFELYTHLVYKWSAGELWGAYLVTIAHFYEELPSQELAELKAIKSVKLSLNLSSRRLISVTISQVTRFV